MNAYFVRAATDRGRQSEPTRHATLAAARAAAETMLNTSEKWREVRIWRKTDQGWTLCEFLSAFPAADAPTDATC